VTIAIPAGAAHDADGAASLEPIIVDNTVTDHGACTPVDVLTVINWINSHPAGAGEGEAAPSDFAPVYAFPAV